MFRPKHHEVKLHRPGATVAVAGDRYLMIDARLSMKSKRDRHILREVAAQILNEVGRNDREDRGQPPTLGENGSES